MELYNFKEDLSGSVFRLMGRVLIIAILIQVLVSLLSYVLIMVGAPELHAVSEEMRAITQNSTDPEQILEDLRSLFYGNNTFNYAAVTAVSLVSLVLSLITYNILYNGIRNEVTSGDNSIGSAISGVFDIRLLKYIVITIIVYIALIAVFLILTAIGSGILMALVLVAVLPVIVWFGLSYSAVGLDNASISESLSMTFKTLSIGRLAKVVGIGIVVFISMIVISLIGMGIASLISFIPGIGGLLSQIINAAISGLVVAFFVTGFSGLYYRYSKDTLQEEEYIVTD